jgi:hypothetical protein
MSLQKKQVSFHTLWEQPAEFISHRFAALDFCHSYHTAELYVNGNKKNGAVYYSLLLM